MAHHDFLSATLGVVRGPASPAKERTNRVDYSSGSNDRYASLDARIVSGICSSIFHRRRKCAIPGARRIRPRGVTAAHIGHVLNAPTVNSQRRAAPSTSGAGGTWLSPGDRAMTQRIPTSGQAMDWINNMPFAMSKSLARQTLLSMNKEPEPLPEIWDWFWDTMPFLKAGKKGEPLGLGDVARTFKVNIEQIFGSIPAPDGAPLAAADVEGLDFKALFLGMKTYFDRYGSVFKMCFGPKVRAHACSEQRSTSARTPFAFFFHSSSSHTYIFASRYYYSPLWSSIPIPSSPSTSSGRIVRDMTRAP